MAVSARKVQNKRDGNGELTGKPGTVYDVNIKYSSPQGKKTYSKKGFFTKKEAVQHEAEMKTKLANPVYTPVPLRAIRAISKTTFYPISVMYRSGSLPRLCLIICFSSFLTKGFPIAQYDTHNVF